MRTYPNFTMEYVLYELSYANLVLLSSVIPSYDSKRGKKKGQSDKKINADDPRNKKEILKILSGNG